MKGVDLIFHQRYQRGNDEGRAIKHQGRQLVTERLATACRHNNDGIFALQNCFNHFTLAFAEGVKPKVLMKRCESIGDRMHEAKSKGCES
jgi:hypothetical protein